MVPGSASSRVGRHSRFGIAQGFGGGISRKWDVVSVAALRSATLTTPRSPAFQVKNAAAATRWCARVSRATACSSSDAQVEVRRGRRASSPLGQFFARCAYFSAPRNANVVAVAPTRLLRLDVVDFAAGGAQTELLGDERKNAGDRPPHAKAVVSAIARLGQYRVPRGVHKPNA